MNAVSRRESLIRRVYSFSPSTHAWIRAQADDLSISATEFLRRLVEAERKRAASVARAAAAKR